MLGVTGLHLYQINSSNENQNRSPSGKMSYLFWSLSWIGGHILGGSVFLGLIGLLGTLLAPSLRLYFIIGLVILGLFAALHQFKILTFPMPQLTRQVQRTWLYSLHKNKIAFGYGFQLGTGILTRIKVATTYLVIGFALCTGSIIYGAIIGGLFGFGRAILPILLASKNKTPKQSLDFSLRFNSFDSKVQRLNGFFALVSSCVLSFYFLL